MKQQVIKIKDDNKLKRGHCPLFHIGYLQRLWDKNKGAAKIE